MLKKSAKADKTDKTKKTAKTKAAASKSGKPSEATQSPEMTQQAGLPLFFSNPQALDKERHAKAAIRPVLDYNFTKETNSIPLNTIEFIEAVKDFPIVFTADEVPAPAAVVGLKQQNYFVEKDGSWKTHSYVPAYVRQYPFVFFEQKEEEKFYLCIDEASSAFLEHKVGESQALFTDGEPTPATQNALDFCTAFYNHHQITQNFCKDLKKHNLLVPYHSEAVLESGEKINLAGFMMIDEQRFNALSDEVILEFRKSGWLAFIYLALAAASNWKTLFAYAAESENAAPQKVSNIKEA